MDDPSDSCWTWPYWKFGLKKDDLFGSLHAQYNTVPSPILDPEAFHHDVYEISNQATTPDEFHSLLHERKQQRLRELNETFESAAFEIIANPSLIGTEQWQHAVQLFRTRSLDSLVRLFASYLPADHPWYKSASSSEAGSSVGSLTDSDSHDSEFEDEDGPLLTEEPFEYPSYPKELLPPSPRSMTMCSDSSVASPTDEHHGFDFAVTTPACLLSFSESEPDCCATPEACCDCSRLSRCTDFQLTTTHETTADGVEDSIPIAEQASSRESLTLPPPISDVTDSETPTPRPEAHSTSFFDDTKRSPIPHRRYRSLSPSRPQPLSQRDLDQVLTAHRDPRNPQRSRLNRRERECSPASRSSRRRGSPAERVQKPQPESARSRPGRSRRWVDS
ncbi:hypothetical protein VTI74DRAFT_5394 [Chaetomium olivicolor]